MMRVTDHEYAHVREQSLLTATVASVVVDARRFARLRSGVHVVPAEQLGDARLHAEVGDRSADRRERDAVEAAIGLARDLRDARQGALVVRERLLGRVAARPAA